MTILATGFGVEDVEPKEERARREGEDRKRAEEEEEKRQKRQERIEHYYGGDGNNSLRKRRPHIYIFQPDDLDNDDVILAVENTPTYKRTRPMLEDIRKQGSAQSGRQYKR